jgi:hypothetical protein
MLSVLVRDRECKTSQTGNGDRPKARFSPEARGRCVPLVNACSAVFILYRRLGALPAARWAAGALLMSAPGTILPLMQRHLDAYKPISVGLVVTQSGHSGLDDSARATSEGESREDRTPVVV